MNFLKRLFGLDKPTHKPIREPKVEGETEARIRYCPWPKDIYIERSSFVAGGHFGTVKGKHYHSVSCAADGPNGDKDKTMHHAYIGYWGDFRSFDEANDFAVKLWEKIMVLTKLEVVPVYASKKDKNNHARWCMGEIKRRPKGITPDELPITFKAYEYG